MDSADSGSRRGSSFSTFSSWRAAAEGVPGEVPQAVPAGGGGTSTTPPLAGTPTIAITSPTQNSSLPVGDVSVVLATSHFTVGGTGETFAKLYLDTDPVSFDVYNGSTKQVVHQGATPVQAEWVSPNQVRMLGLPVGHHKIHVELVAANGTRIPNPEAQAAVVFGVGVPAITAPSIILDRPESGAVLPSGSVLVSFLALNHAIGLNGQTHLHFYVDGASERHEFFNGVGISEENGVQLNGAHTHFVHWKSPTSFMMYGVTPGEHTVSFALANAAHNELSNPEATATVTFSVTGVSGSSEFLLEPVLSNVNARMITFAADGRLFYAEGQAGNVWIVDTAGGAWQQRTTPFYHTEVGALGEQGLSGIALDPNYASNGFVYVYFTMPDGATNRVVRVKDVNGQATEETVILAGLLAADQHNGGIIKFGPDGKLYVTVGEATQDQLAQDLGSYNGKILRINGDGSIPPDNPFAGSAVWAYGVRNSFGVTFHPATGDLWFTDNGPSVDDEVNLAVRGGNFGWPLATGTTGAPPLLNSAFVLPQPVGITNIVALASTPVYAARYHNNLFFTDFVEGKIHRLQLDPTFKTVATSSVVFDGGVGGLIGFVQGPDGYLYVTGFDSIYRVVANPNAAH